MLTCVDLHLVLIRLTLGTPRHEAVVRGGFIEYPQSICFRVKIRRKKKKNTCVPLYTPVLQHKSGVSGGMHFPDMLS